MYGSVKGGYLVSGHERRQKHQHVPTSLCITYSEGREGEWMRVCHNDEVHHGHDNQPDDSTSTVVAS